MTDSIGGRVHDIRRRLGPDERTDMPLAEFANLLTRTARALGIKKSFDGSELSKLERGLRKKERVTLAEIDVIAHVDPLERGRDWLAWGDLPTLSLGDNITNGAAVVQPTKRKKNG